MTKGRRPNKIKTHAHASSPVKENRRLIVVTLLIGILAISAVLVAIWTTAQSDGDIFIALAGGRDILHGKLAQPDDWSFTTAGQVWINQNWGSDLIFFLIYRFLGQSGLLGFKLLLLVAGCYFLLKALRARGIPLHILLPLVSFGVFCFRYHAFLRPNLIALLIFIPLFLWLLVLSEKKPVFLWLTGLLTVIWANFHGSFIIGLWMFIFWGTLQFIFPVPSFKPCEKKRLSLLIPILVTILGTIVLNPFGIKNLTASLAAFQDPIWSNNIHEWEPVWQDDFSGLYPELTAFLLIFAACFIHRIISIRKQFNERTRLSPKPESKPSIHKETPLKASPWLDKTEFFETVIAIGAIGTALFSRRLIPVAVLLSLCPLSRWWAFAHARGWFLNRKYFQEWPGILAGVIVLGLAGSLCWSNFSSFSGPESYFEPAGIYEKLQFENSDFPVKLAKFIETNHIAGQAFSAWNWEGYLRLKCPVLKLYTGGRAQQIYKGKTYRNYLNLSGGDPSPELLEQNRIRLLVLPAGSFSNLIKKVLRGGNWVVVYGDEKDLLLADSRAPENRRLIDESLQGQFIYPDQDTRILSRYALNLGAYRKISVAEKISLFTEASNSFPANPWIYFDLSEMLFNSDQATREKIERLYWKKLDEFMESYGKPSTQKIIYAASDEVLSSLIRYYEKINNEEGIEKIKQYIEKVMGIKLI